jgi:hypothetical protein
MYAAELFLDMRVARGRLKRDNGRAAGLVAIHGQNTGANQYGRNRNGHESSSPNWTQTHVPLRYLVRNPDRGVGASGGL